MLTREQVHKWNSQFPPQLETLWQGIRVFARRLADVVTEEQGAEGTQAFLFSVGNFKRQAPLFPGPLPKEVAPSWQADETVDLWGVGRLSRDDPISWERLTDVSGIGVPTATTVLSALWPEIHAIFDVLTVQSATALRGASGHWDGPIGAKDARVPSPPRFDRATWLTWECYSWYRESCIVATARALGVPPQQVERTLFLAIRWQFDNRAAPREESWEAYGKRLRACLDAQPS